MDTLNDTPSTPGTPSKLVPRPSKMSQQRRRVEHEQVLPRVARNLFIAPVSNHALMPQASPS